MVVAVALVVNLALLDLISTSVLTETLGKTLSVLAVTTLAAVLVLLIVKGARKP
jgi:hypothetical protein